MGEKARGWWHNWSLPRGPFARANLADAAVPPPSTCPFVLPHPPTTPLPTPPTHPSTQSDQAVCWICLDAARPDAPLGRACACPRHTHAQCLARWQLQSAGSRKETHCEFCDGQLPDWKAALTPGSGAAAPAVMNVNFDGRTYSFEVKPGIDGYRAFTEAIRRAFSLPDDSELNITFTCDEPCTAGSPAAPVAPVAATPGSLLTLQGAGAYDAAVHCASVSASRRLMQGGGGAPGAPPTPPQPDPLGAARRDDLTDDATSAGAGPSGRRPRSGGERSAGGTGGAPASGAPGSGLGRKLRNAIADMLSAK